jgi:hypothetical protein
MNTTLILTIYCIGIVTGLLVAHAYHTITPTRRRKSGRTTPAKRGARTVEPSAVPEMKDGKRKQQVQPASPWAGPVRKAVPKPTVDQAHQVLAEDAYRGLLQVDDEDWHPTVVRYTAEEYKAYRATNGGQ